MLTAAAAAAARVLLRSAGSSAALVGGGDRAAIRQRWRRRFQRRRRPPPHCCYQAHNLSSAATTSSPPQPPPHIKHLLRDHAWLLRSPDTRIDHIPTTTSSPHEPNSSGFWVVRDDLLHPLLGGNKARKLDTLIPALRAKGVTDVVTCGGVQSAHTAAVAVACAESNMSSHLLLRGERPTQLTGYALLCHIYGTRVVYVKRDAYADRAGMLERYVGELRKDSNGVVVGTVNEGADEPGACLGVIRLVEYLSRPGVLPPAQRYVVVIDSGTGTTAVAFALGISLLGLSGWSVLGVMLADTRDVHVARQQRLVEAFHREYPLQSSPVADAALPLTWVDRLHPRRFGKVLGGEIERCSEVARATGMLLDPIYTLAGYEWAEKLALNNVVERHDDSVVVMVHTGGTLAHFGLAQRFGECY